MEPDPYAMEASLLNGSKISLMYDGQIIEVSDNNLDAKELLKVVITLYLATHGIIKPPTSNETTVEPTLPTDGSENHTDGPYI